MSSMCELKHHSGIDASCDQDRCPYWRAVDHLHLSPGTHGCAIQYFGLLGERGAEISRWLLSVKERVEAVDVATPPVSGVAPDAPGDASCQMPPAGSR